MRFFRENLFRVYGALGIDRAIGVSSANQLVRFFTGPITMILIIRYLSPEEQGFYYSFAGVLGIRVFLEAGFAVSITQFAAREFAGLRFTRDEVLTGKAENLSRLRSISQKASRYYSVMAGFLFFGLAVGGYLFFSSKPSEVDWQIPWIVVSVCAGFQFWLTPFFATLEGCNRVADVATYRFGMTIVGFVSGALGLIIAQSIWVAVYSSVGTLLAAYVYIFVRWRAFFFQIRRNYRPQFQVGWLREIWSFQWRTGTVWASKYVLFFTMAPLAMVISTPEIAGRIGMTFQLFFVGASVAAAFTNTKVPRWGTMISRGEQERFLNEWKRASFVHFFLSTVVAIVMCTSFVFIDQFFADVAERFLPFYGFLILGIAMALHAIWLCFAHYFRSVRHEPYVPLTILAAAIFLMGTAILNDFPEGLGIATAFLAANAFAAIMACRVWLGQRNIIWK